MTIWEAIIIAQEILGNKKFTKISYCVVKSLII